MRRENRERPNPFKTGDMDLIIYLTLRGIRPTRRSVEDDSKAALYYDHTGELSDAVVEYQNKCPVCGIAFSEVGLSRAEAKRMLLDGNLNERREK